MKRQNTEIESNLGKYAQILIIYQLFVKISLHFNYLFKLQEKAVFTFNLANTILDVDIES